MDEIEKLEESLIKEDIYIYEVPTETNSTDAFVVQFDKKNYICINKEKEMNKVDKRMCIEHEHSHILTDSFYFAENKKRAIRRRERIANDNLVTRLNLVFPVCEYLKKDYENWQICEELRINQDVLAACVDYAKRKSLI